MGTAAELEVKADRLGSCDLVRVQEPLKHRSRIAEDFIGAFEPGFRAPEVYHTWIVFKTARNAFRTEFEDRRNFADA
jgi:hypothetical protein